MRLNLLGAVLENQAVIFIDERKLEAIAARIEDAVLHAVGTGGTGPFKRRSRVGGRNMERNHVVVRSFGLAADKLADPPGVVARCVVFTGVLTRTEGSSAGKAASGEEEGGNGSELHFDSWESEELIAGRAVIEKLLMDW